MDSVTQFVLGASIGEATLRVNSDEDGSRPLVWSAALLGGLVGTLPDLDVFVSPALGLDGPDTLASHRGLSHSLFFCTLITPLLAYVFHRLFPRSGVSLRRWNIFVWLGLNTHWMLDALTMYGTQIFQPFSNYPVNGSSVFIVDPIYTGLLMAGLLLSLWRNRKGRSFSGRRIMTGLLLSTCYLGFTLVSKYTVLPRFIDSWEEKGMEYRQIITVPTPLNSILWYAYVDTGTDVWVANSSLFDSRDRVIEWKRIPKNTELLPRFGEGKAGRVLLWFSRGFYRLDIKDGRPVLTDLRFGRMKSWLVDSPPEGEDYIFMYLLKPEQTEGPYQDFGRYPRISSRENFPWELLWDRIWGRS